MIIVIPRSSVRRRWRGIPSHYNNNNNNINNNNNNNNNNINI